MRELVIDGRTINDDTPAYVVAEIGHNHAGSVELAMKMAFTAKASGASAVKFQTRCPKDVYAATAEKGGYFYQSDNPQWMDRVYGVHREKLEFSPEQWRDLFAYCKHIGITAFSTPFDHKSADLLASLGVPALKIASGDATNIPLIKHVASFGKPVIVSTGGCVMADVYRAIEAFNTVASPAQIAILQCSCIYPAPDDVMNLRVIESYWLRFPDIVVGLSTHNPSWIPSLVAYSLGARIFEHHFTNDKTWKGTDNAFSLDPTDMRAFVNALESARQSLGNAYKEPDPRELLPTIERRKKLVWTRDLPAGHEVVREDLIAKCPGNGIPPYEMDTVIGHTLSQDVNAEEVVNRTQIVEPAFA